MTGRRQGTTLATLVALAVALVGGAPAHASDAELLGAAYAPRDLHVLPTGDPLNDLASLRFKPTQLGGTLSVYVHNRGAAPLDVGEVRLNGLPLDAWSRAVAPDTHVPLLADGLLVQWWRLDADPVPPGGVGVLTIAGTALLEGTPAKLEVDTSAGTLRAEPALRRARARPVALAFGDRLDAATAYLEADRPVRIRGATLAGRPIRWEGPQTIVPGAPAKLELDFGERLERGATAVVGVELDGETVYVHRHAEPARFVLGVAMGFGRRTLPGAAELAALRDAGVDTFVARNHRFPIDDLLAIAEEEGAEVLVGAAAGAEAGFLDLVRRLRGHPAVAGWMPRDEPDIPIPPPLGYYRSSAWLADTVARTRAADPTHPINVNLFGRDSMPEYAPIPDVPSFDHYPFQGPSRPPLRVARTWAEAMRSAAAPKPFWFWAQAVAIADAGGIDFPGTGRLPTADETRAYNLLAIGHGATGLLWFTFDSSDFPTSPLYPEIRFQGRVLDALGDQLARGTAWPGGASVRGAQLDASTIVAPDLAALTLVNLRYAADPAAYRFAERRGVEVRWRLPAWLRDRELTVAEVTPEGVRELGPARPEMRLRLDVRSGTLLVAAERQTLARLRP